MGSMSRRELTALFVIGENPAQSDADLHHVSDALAGLDHLVVQEIVLTKTAELAHVVLPAAVSSVEGEGTVTNSERRVQRVRKVVDPPGAARDELWILAELAKRLGADFGYPTAEQVWNEFRVVAPRRPGLAAQALQVVRVPHQRQQQHREHLRHGRVEVARHPHPRPPL